MHEWSFPSWKIDGWDQHRAEGGDNVAGNFRPILAYIYKDRRPFSTAPNTLSGLPKFKYLDRIKVSALKLILASAVGGQVAMITKHITEVTTRFNPFTKPSKTCRVFLAHLPANARTTMKINTMVLNRDSQEPSFLALKFSTCFTPTPLVPIQLILADQMSS